MRYKKTNKVRTFLLIQTDNDVKEYIKHSFTYINTKPPTDLATQYDNDYIVNFDNSIANNLNTSNHPFLTNNSTNKNVFINSNEESIINFTKNIIAQGQDFITYKKIDLGSKKLLCNKKNNLFLNLNEEVTIKSFCKSTKSISKQIKLNPAKIVFMTKAEQKAKLLQENYDYLNELALSLKDIFEESESDIISNKNSFEYGSSNKQIDSPSCFTPIGAVPTKDKKFCFSFFGQVYQSETDVARSVKTNEDEKTEDKKEVSSFIFEIE